MATDIAKVAANLTSFYDFRNKSVVHVGAGGGQFIGYASAARHVVAVDSDAAALEPLRAAIDRQGLGERFTVRQARFESYTGEADVVFFEVCGNRQRPGTRRPKHHPLKECADRWRDYG